MKSEQRKVLEELYDEAYAAAVADVAKWLRADTAWAGRADACLLASRLESGDWRKDQADAK